MHASIVLYDCIAANGLLPEHFEQKTQPAKRLMKVTGAQAYRSDVQIHSCCILRNIARLNAEVQVV